MTNLTRCLFYFYLSLFISGLKLYLLSPQTIQEDLGNRIGTADPELLEKVGA